MLRELGTTGRSEVIREAFLVTGFAELTGHGRTLLESLVTLFGILRTHYRCDYIYRTALTNNLYLGRHSPASSVLLFELRVWRSKADVAIFNGTSVAYEIKSELDNLDRLASQVEDYSSVFDRIFVVTNEDREQAVRAVVPEHVGILVLTPRCSLKTARAAESNADRVRPGSIIDALRKDEFTAVTRLVTGAVPMATSVNLADVCREAVEAHAPRVVHDAMVRVVKKRRRVSREHFAGVRPELVAGYLESGLKPESWPSLTSALTSTTIGHLISNDGRLFPVFPNEASGADRSRECHSATRIEREDSSGS